MTGIYTFNFVDAGLMAHLNLLKTHYDANEEKRMSGKIEISRDLLPCPFCGKDKTHFHHYSRKIGFDVYHCIRCYCCAETIGWTPEEAAQCWNTRAAQVVERQGPVSVPDGWKLVPIEPTEYMMKVARGLTLQQEQTPSAEYRAMVKAAPACLDKVKELNS